MYKVGEVVKIKKELFIVKEFKNNIFSCEKCSFGKQISSIQVACTLPKFYQRKDGLGRCPLYAHCSFIKIGKGGV